MFQQASDHDSWAPYVVRTLATKLGLEIVSGDPDMNILRTVFSPPLLGGGDFDVNLRGAPHGLPVELHVMQRSAPGYTAFDAGLSLLAPQPFDPFEVLSRRQIPHLPMAERTTLPPCATGDAELDARFLVKTSDAATAARIAQCLNSFQLFEPSGVHLLGDGTRIAFVMTRSAAPILASTLYYGAPACEALAELADAVTNTVRTHRPIVAVDDSDQTPIPCRRCGAPMREEPPSAAPTVMMRCTFCGSEESLPVNRAARVLQLRKRLREIGWAREAREGAAIGVARVAEAYPRMMKPAGLLVGGMTAFSLLRAGVAVFSSDADLLPVLVTLMSVLVVPAVFALVIGATTLALRAYAKELRPLLEALPGDATSAASLRCRCCGAPITSGAHDGAFVTCTYCNAPNLIGEATAEHRAAQLTLEVERWRAAAQGDQSLIEAAATRYRTLQHLLAGGVVLLMLGGSFFMSLLLSLR